MSKQEDDSLVSLCRQLREAAPEIVDWLEAEIITDYSKPNHRIAQIEDMGEKAHAFRRKSLEFAVQATKRFKEHGFRPQAVVDFAIKLDKSFVNLPTCVGDVLQIGVAKHEAEAVIDAVERILTQAGMANDGDSNPPIWCTHMDVLRADGLEKRAKYLDELASKNKLTILERGAHKKPSLVRFADPKYREKVEQSMRDFQRDGSKPARQNGRKPDVL